MSDRADLRAMEHRGSASPPGFRGTWKTFDELDTCELYALLRLRAAVFVVEQSCPYADIDGQDGSALHFMARIEDVPELAGCLRVFAPGIGQPCARIGRVATAAPLRGTGLGRRMMREAFAEIERRFGPVAIEISAQVEAERFYAGLGFVRVSGEYREDGIAHCDMRRSDT